MTVEYDLIVIGGNPVGIHAAIAATQLNARVALVNPQSIQTNGFGHGAIYHQTLTQVGRIVQQVRDAPQFGIYSSIADSTQQAAVPSVQLTQAMQWASAVVSTCSELTAAPVLASLGIDVIAGDGEFCRLPHLGFVVNNRRLRGRAYLIATGSRPEIPDIEGLSSISYLTPATFWHQETVEAREKESGKTQHLQGSWVVMGGNSLGIELAQTLTRLNCQVTLVISESNILPEEDSEASRLIQAQLEAEGIRVLTQSPVTQVRQIENKKWVQAGNRALEADEILVATGQQPNIEALNLEGVGVKFSQDGVELNEKLQTTNPRIYACGIHGGGYHPHIAEYEASIALKNALFYPLFKVNYRGIPRTVFTEPQLARVGLTEAQAREQYGKDVWVVRQYFKTLEKAQLLGETTGFCKFVVRRSGEILGASIVGAQASELIGAIALAMQQNIKMGAIANLPHVSPTFSEILQKTAQEWRQQRLNHNRLLKNVLESFFHLRRNWS
ncbi:MULTISPECIES: dihydrolipoyl dehydrogenase family protein [unclassified Coleofasciculus]|uniref:dihydrolipoyl dehydrogenase family protein n=1 Tax=unclassified Coleofasciculus TaxID=2692782 RepID=UPI0018830EB2|nr:MULTISPECIES: FAD-dependent oxidoreductase [unclassified Coleofasciculus]MBE9126170.1 FAD-dependent oxidoreductase [Coleofasciculus sp. LEGE 07081]MBE9149623.1 FAD-dependent oxidoreductase [Coleofasciculus sp. LEGE 07092]